MPVAVVAALQAAPPMHDQWFLLTRPGLPFDCGMASCAFAKAAGWLSLDLTATNTVLKVVAAGLAVSGLWAALPSVRVSAPCLALFIASGLPLVWTSADVFAAAGVAWTFAARRPVPFLLASVLLMFAKPDLLIPGWALAMVWAQAWRVRALVSAVAVVLTVIGLSSAHQTDRATMAFSQHFAAVTNGPAAFDQWTKVDLREMVTTEPHRYARFVVGSVRESLRQLWASGVWIVALLAMGAGWFRRDRVTLGAAVFAGLSMAVVTSMAYLHFRYLGRFMAVGLIVIAHAWPVSPRWLKIADVVGLVGLTGWYVWQWPDWPIVD